MQAPGASKQHPLIRKMAGCIESLWQQSLELSAYTLPEDLGYVEGSLEGERLIIENRCYQAPQFRKLHLELAQIGNGLSILHCVMFPNPDYALPIFGTDLVGGPGGISAAIVDLSPITVDRTLAPQYHRALSSLPKSQFAQPRALPEWGDIFSDFCLFVRPVDVQEEEQFLQQVQGFLMLHCQFARTAQPLSAASGREQVLAGQKNYCMKQQQNQKTRRILEKSFGPEWTERYMSTMLFDLAD